MNNNSFIIRLIKTNLYFGLIVQIILLSSCISLPDQPGLFSKEQFFFDSVVQANNYVEIQRNIDPSIFHGNGIGGYSVFIYKNCNNEIDDPEEMCSEAYEIANQLYQKVIQKSERVVIIIVEVICADDAELSGYRFNFEVKNSQLFKD